MIKSFMGYLSVDKINFYLHCSYMFLPFHTIKHKGDDHKKFWVILKFYFHPLIENVKNPSKLMIFHRIPPY